MCPLGLLPSCFLWTPGNSWLIIAYSGVER